LHAHGAHLRALATPGARGVLHPDARAKTEGRVAQRNDPQRARPGAAGEITWLLSLPPEPAIEGDSETEPACQRRAGEADLPRGRDRDRGRGCLPAPLALRR